MTLSKLRLIDLAVFLTDATAHDYPRSGHARGVTNREL